MFLQTSAMCEADVHEEEEEKKEEDGTEKRFAKDGLKAVYVRQIRTGSQCLPGCCVSFQHQHFQLVVGKDRHQIWNIVLRRCTTYQQNYWRQTVTLTRRNVIKAAMKKVVTFTHLVAFSVLAAWWKWSMYLPRKFVLNFKYHHQQSALTSRMWETHCSTSCTKTNTLRYDGHMKWEDVKCVD